MNAEQCKQQARTGHCIELLNNYPDITTEAERTRVNRFRKALRFFELAVVLHIPLHYRSSVFVNTASDQEVRLMFSSTRTKARTMLRKGIVKNMMVLVGTCLFFQCMYNWQQNKLVTKYESTSLRLPL